mmetsp:Transcript_6708/g.19229  ORF Transcript_6708/g.19229 Transcript_6708/m.19229 type:complete len:83 (-) Transcript_6708:347-595(-)
MMRTLLLIALLALPAAALRTARTPRRWATAPRMAEESGKDTELHHAEVDVSGRVGSLPPALWRQFYSALRVAAARATSCGLG